METRKLRGNETTFLLLPISARFSHMTCFVIPCIYNFIFAGLVPSGVFKLVCVMLWKVLRGDNFIYDLGGCDWPNR